MNMDLCIAVPKKDAEKARRQLLAQHALDLSRLPARDATRTYFPITTKISSKFGRLVSKKLNARKTRPQSLREALQNDLTETQLELLTRAFDVIGDLAIIEIEPKLARKARAIGRALMFVHPNVKAVYAKAGRRQGAFRVRKREHVAGAKRTTTIHKEAGCEFKLDIAKAYFSPRLMHERKRIAQLAKPNEKILALFAGVGPFPIQIAKRAPSVQIKAIELNPDAVKHMRENIRRNGVSGSVEPIEGEAHEVISQKFANWADRILMTYPHGAYRFLDDAFYAAKPGCTIHFYYFAKEENAFKEAEGLVKNAAAKANRKINLINRRVVLPFAPGVVQDEIDFEIP